MNLTIILIYLQASSSSSFRNDLQTTSQRSSLTDSREQSLSVEGEEVNDGGNASPPAIKKRKISSQESSESCPGILDFGLLFNHQGT